MPIEDMLETIRSNLSRLEHGAVPSQQPRVEDLIDIRDDLDQIGPADPDELNEHELLQERYEIIARPIAARLQGSCEKQLERLEISGQSPESEQFEQGLALARQALE